MVHPQKPENFSPKITVSGCCIEHDGEVLLLLRNKEESHPDTWGFPSGKHDGDEDMHDAILREVWEETGMRLERDALRYAGPLYVTAGEVDIAYHQFHVVLPERALVTLRAEEHRDYRWVSPQEALANLPLIHDLDSCFELIYKG